MGQIIYVGDTEIESEPDNDSDDAGFSSTPDNPSHPLALPIVMQSPPDATNFQSTAQQIVTQLANIAGQPLSYVYQPQTDGSIVMDVKDQNGNLTNTVIFFADGSTNNITPIGGDSLQTFSAVPSSDPHTTALTSLYQSGDVNLENTFFNATDGTSLKTQYDLNSDGSMTFVSAPPADLPNTNLGEPSDTTIDTVIDDSLNYARDKIIKFFQGSTSATVSATAGILENSVYIAENLKNIAQLSLLTSDLTDELLHDKDWTKTATELSAKVASTALSIAGVPYSDTIVKGDIAFGNLVVGAIGDAIFEWYQSNGQQSPDNTLQTTPIQQDPTGPYLFPDSASTDAPSSSQVLYEWSGLDTAGFSSVAWGGVGVGDVTKNMTNISTADLYNGPVAGLQYQYINESPDNLNVSAASPNMFVHTGAGEDAIDVSQFNGNNVLDGSTGSNFLVGGTGDDTFFVDDRSPPANIWSTVANFHAGDAATIFGITQQGFGASWVDGQGATGYTGLTLHVTSSGHPTASLTLAGFSTADLSNGRISNTWGTEPDGTPYLYVHANS